MWPFVPSIIHFFNQLIPYHLNLKDSDECNLKKNKCYRESYTACEISEHSSFSKCKSIEANNTALTFFRNPVH